MFLEKMIYNNATTNLNLEELSMADDKRKLTEKELKRKDCFEKFSSEMQQKGYKIKKVNVFNLDGISWGFLFAE